MQKLSWEDIIEAQETCPQSDKTGEFIIMQGAFDVSFPQNKNAPKELYELTSNLESRMHEFYPHFSIVGEESVPEPNPKDQGIRYLGQIYGMNEFHEVLTEIYLHAVQAVPEVPVDTTLTFQARFPLGNYLQNTNKFLKSIWDRIEAFDYEFPESQSNVPQGSRGDQYIFLFEDGKPLASGEYALKKAPLTVEPKKTVLVMSGISIF